MDGSFCQHALHSEQVVIRLFEALSKALEVLISPLMKVNQVLSFSTYAFF